MTVAKKKVDELHEFVKGKKNVHHQIRHLVVEIRRALHCADRERMAQKKKTEDAEGGSEDTGGVGDAEGFLRPAREQKRPRNAARERILVKNRKGTTTTRG